MANNYNSKSIIHLEDREAMRKKGSQYIGGFDQNGLNQTILEVISNAIDEYLNGFGEEVLITYYKDKSISIKDTGRGIPVGKNRDGEEAFEVALTKLHTSGKYLDDGSTGYNISGGTHGIGLKAAVYLSEFCIATSNFGNEIHKLYFKDGIKEKELENLGETKEKGTVIHFKPDLKIFKEAEVDINYIIEEVQNLSYLSKGLKFIIKDENSGLEKTIISKNGLLDYLSDLNKGKKVLNKPFYFNKKNKELSCEVELALQFNETSSTDIKLFTNSIPNKTGTHWTGFSAAFTRNINSYGRKEELIKEKDDNLSGSDLQSGMTLIINVKIPEPTFSSQTKENLSDKRGRTVVEKATNEELKTWLIKNKKEAKLIINKMLAAQRADKAAKKKKEAIDGLKIERDKLSLKRSVNAEKFCDCKSKDTNKNELVICEGNSAAGSLKNGRDSNYQAILGLRGKIFNSEKETDLSKLLHDKGVIKDIVNLIGTGIDEAFNIKKLNYGKIVIATDADVDGQHISILLITLFFNHFRELIDEGRIYEVVTPLYKLTKGKEVIYVNTDEELSKIDKKGYQIDRFKGLGEMDADQLFTTMMDREKRQLKRITINDAKRAAKTIEDLMGKSVEPRRNFIRENSYKARIVF